MIFYFSGTGNSEYAAKQISEVLGEPAVNLNDKIKEKEGTAVKPEERLVFVVPTYAWRIPRLVEAWIQKVRFEGTHKVYFVMTCGGGIGNAEKYLQKLCEQKHFTYMGCAEIVMPENYIAMYPAPEEMEAKMIVTKAVPEIRKAAEYIRDGRKLPEIKITLQDKIKSGIINDIYYPVCVHADKFYAKDNCIGCGKCEKACPLNNVKLQDNRPVWGTRCTHCMACICGCPVEAIEYGKKSEGQPRYQCPV